MTPPPPCAYIGPGAGLAVTGSFLILLAALALGLLALLTLPARLLWALLRRPPEGRFRRCVIAGFDGMDPRRAARLMDEGRLPHLARLRDRGSFHKLGTTCPPISPVAWSTFLTGVNPGKHGVYDFLARDLRTCLPELSSARIDTDGRGRPRPAALRKGRPFWQVLGEHGVFSTVLRVPVTFPPEPFNGLCLSGMCAPDIRGTQGEFTLFDADPAVRGGPVGGLRLPVTPRPRGRGLEVRASLPGPVIRGRAAEVDLRVRWRPGADRARLRLPGGDVVLRRGEQSPWQSLTFRRGLTRVRAVARFLLVATEPHLRLYVTPLNIDPGRPATPVSWPPAYSAYLAKLHGPFATLGLAEDTWALTGGAIGDEAFLSQAHAVHEERESMFLNALRLTRRGLCLCVFDLTDRVQHTFMGRETAPPSRPEAGGPPPPPDTAPNPAIDDAYARCDALVGKLLRRCGKKDLLLVLSDHGFTEFRRCVNVNAWLREQGYLAEKKPGDASDCLRNVDWSRTRAYSFGLAGIYLNLRGREARGIVEPGREAAAVKAAIAEGLMRLRDPQQEGRAVARRVYDAARTYRGPYTGRAPDLVAGWHPGYRHSWETAVGRTDGPVLADNASRWCGDHCVDREAVPGVLFSNRRIVPPERGPHLLDFAPTLLRLWNIPVPRHMDGRAWDIE